MNTAERHALADRLEAFGESKVVEELQVARSTVSRAVAGQTLQRATVLAIRVYLADRGRGPALD